MYTGYIYKRALHFPSANQYNRGAVYRTGQSRVTISSIWMVKLEAPLKKNKKNRKI